MADVFTVRLKKNYEPILRDLEPRQVLNYLYQEDVIDEDLRDEIRAERTRKRQAEILLDSLGRRGTEAVQYFIQGLQNSSQNYLAGILQKPVPNESAGISQSAGGDNNCYPMNHNPSGIAIIINNAVFENKTKLEYREGSEQDVFKMKELFEGLQFDVQVYRNRTACQMTEDIETLSHKDHTQYDCCVLFLMSHGREGEIYGTDGEVIKIEDITAWFTAKSCPTLAGKPKLFFVQACRGSKPDVGYDVIESPAEASPPPIQERNANEPQTDLNISQSRKISHVIPDNADMFFAFASSPRFAALRNTLSGGWFVNQLYQVMMKYASREDLMSMMVRITGNVAGMNCQNSEQKYKQCPQLCSQLRKKFFFQPRNVIQ